MTKRKHKPDQLTSKLDAALARRGVKLTSDTGGKLKHNLSKAARIATASRQQQNEENT